MTVDRAAGTPFQQGLGIHWEEIDGEPGAMAAELDVTTRVRGPAGSLEGGVIATLVDCAGAAAAVRALGAMVATEHLTLSFLAPGRVGPVRAEGRLLRVGRRDAVVDVRVLDLGNDGRLMAVAQMTVRSLGQPLPEFPLPDPSRPDGHSRGQRTAGTPPQ
ncbi:MAG: PaaI family thioesterase [Acidimicrobiales bacterium]